MKKYWKKLLSKTVIWLATEILLTFVGLDNLADYSEFIFGQELTTEFHNQPIATVLFK